MPRSFDTVHNRLESLVFQAVHYLAARYPTVAEDDDLLADVACVALNRLPARYIRYPVDFSFYRAPDDRAGEAKTIDTAVLAAFEYVYARTASSARQTVTNLDAEGEIPVGVPSGK